MPLFGKSQKSPAELVKALKEAVTALERGDKKAEKAQEDVSKNLVSVFVRSSEENRCRRNMRKKYKNNNFNRAIRTLTTDCIHSFHSFIQFLINDVFTGSYQKYVVWNIRFGATN